MSTVLKTKSDINYKVALSFVKNEEISNYHICIHCLYYSCLQLMLHITEGDEVQIHEESDSDNGSTHKKIINIFFDKIAVDTDLRTARYFKSKINSLKARRVQADYSNFEVTEEILKVAIAEAEQIRYTLFTYFDI